VSENEALHDQLAKAMARLAGSAAADRAAAAAATDADKARMQVRGLAGGAKGNSVQGGLHRRRAVRLTRCSNTCTALWGWGWYSVGPQAFVLCCAEFLGPAEGDVTLLGCGGRLYVCMFAGSNAAAMLQHPACKFRNACCWSKYNHIMPICRWGVLTG